MDYRRYSLGTYSRKKWVECTECGDPEKPSTVWEGAERAVNMAFVIDAIMRHEIAAHASRPQIRRNR